MSKGFNPFSLSSIKLEDLMEDIMHGRHPQVEEDLVATARMTAATLESVLQNLEEVDASDFDERYVIHYHAAQLCSILTYALQEGERRLIKEELGEE